MGRLLYGSQEREIEIDDRALAHLHVVLVNKLRRAESFTFTWGSTGDAGRATVWLHPAIPLQFYYESIQSPALNRAWLTELTESAARGDLRLTEEPTG